MWRNWKVQQNKNKKKKKENCTCIHLVWHFWAVCLVSALLWVLIAGDRTALYPLGLLRWWVDRRVSTCPSFRLNLTGPHRQRAWGGVSPGLAPGCGSGNPQGRILVSLILLLIQGDNTLLGSLGYLNPPFTQLVWKILYFLWAIALNLFALLSIFTSYLLSNNWQEINTLWLENTNVFNLHGSNALLNTNALQKVGYCKKWLRSKLIIINAFAFLSPRTKDLILSLVRKHSVWRVNGTSAVVWLSDTVRSGAADEVSTGLITKALQCYNHLWWDSLFRWPESSYLNLSTN